MDLKELLTLGKKKEYKGKTYIIIGQTAGGWMVVEENSTLPATPVWLPNKELPEEKLKEMGFDISEKPKAEESVGENSSKPKRKRGRPRKNPVPIEPPKAGEVLVPVEVPKEAPPVEVPTPVEPATVEAVQESPYPEFPDPVVPE